MLNLPKTNLKNVAYSNKKVIVPENRKKKSGREINFCCGLLSLISTWRFFNMFQKGSFYPVQLPV